MRIETLSDLVVFRIAAGKANAMGRPFLDGLNGLLDELRDRHPAARAVVVTGYERYFSAGLDLPTLIGLDRGEMERLIAYFSSTMLRLFRLPLPVVAAVNGHAIAGGCVLALQADRRVMAIGDGRIGLSEVRLGIGLPSLVVETLRSQVPPASMAKIALEGRLFSAQEARDVGLVDEVVSDDTLWKAALANARELAALPREAFSQIKGALRRPFVDEIVRSGDDEVLWVDTWFSESGQRGVRRAVEELRSRKA